MEMPENIPSHVGSMIKRYRTASGMTMDELAGRINKSKASISKYESGMVALDIVTLFEIADALSITPLQLLDYTPHRESRKIQVSPFGDADTFYLYHLIYGGVHSSVMKLGSFDDVGQTVTLYYKVTDYDSLERAACIYHGHCFNHQTVFNFILENYHNSVEVALLTFFVPFSRRDSFVGMLTGIGDSTFTPAAQKVLLTQEPQKDSPELRKKLTIAPESFKEMKKQNYLFIAQE